MKDLEKEIEEASILYAENDTTLSIDTASKWGFIKGAKSSEAKEYWQQGMYSEEEVKNIVLSAMDYKTDRVLTFTEKIKWFNQNKKKP